MLVIKNSLMLALFFILDTKPMAGLAFALTPSIISPCPGDQLFLVCNTSTSVHQWIIVDPSGIMHSRLVAVPTAQDNDITSLVVRSFTFSFDVISTPNTLPLISTLTCEGVNDQLNNSRIRCLEDNPPENGERVNVHILSPDVDEGVHVDYNLINKQFGLYNVIVVLLIENNISQRLESGPLVYYDVTSSDNMYVKVQREQINRFLLVVPYNILVNVSITASLCGQQSTVPSIIHIHYANCGPPLPQYLITEMELEINSGNDTSLSWPVIEGTTVLYRCLSGRGLILAGPNLSMCMENGKWEPDPKEVTCKRTSKPGGISDVLIASVISSMVTFILTTICFITIIVFICMNVCVRTNVTNCAEVSNNEYEDGTAEGLASNTTYDTVLPTHLTNVRQDLEVKENAAYKSINH